MKSILLFLFLCGAAVAQTPYSYPIGIPDAWIDPDTVRPTRPATWTSEIAGYYYVDNAGSDSGRTYGSPAAPRKTIPNPIPAGSYVEISGTYVGANPTQIKAAGDSGPWVANTSGPVWVCGLNASTRGSFVNQTIFSGTYLCAEYLDNAAGTGAKTQIGSANTAYQAEKILLRHCEFDGQHNTRGTGIVVYGNTVSTASDVVIYDCESHRWGPNVAPPSDPGDPDYDNDFVGIMVQSYADGVWVLDCDMHHCTGSGLVVSSNSSSTVNIRNVFAGRNEIHDTWAAGMAIKTSSNTIFSQNYIHDVQWTTWSAAKGIGAQYFCEKAWFMFNTIEGGDYGIKIGGTNTGVDEYIYIIGNKITGVHDLGTGGGWSYVTAAISVWSGFEKNIVGNTIYDCDNGILLPTAGTTTYVRNNLIVGCTGYDMGVDTSPSSAVFEKNLVYRSGGGESFRRTNTTYTAGAWNAAFPTQEILVADPLFTDAGAGDFSILTASPAKDAGLAPASFEVDVFSNYLSEFGVDISVDINGGARPAGAAWDIGAYEWGGGSAGELSIETLNTGTLNIGTP